MTPEIAQELNRINQHINAVELKLSKFIDTVHGASTEGIVESQSTIVDLEIEIAELKRRVAELEGKEA